MKERRSEKEEERKQDDTCTLVRSWRRREFPTSGEASSPVERSAGKEGKLQGLRGECSATALSVPAWAIVGSYHMHWPRSPWELGRAPTGAGSVCPWHHLLDPTHPAGWLVCPDHCLTGLCVPIATTVPSCLDSLLAPNAASAPSCLIG